MPSYTLIYFNTTGMAESIRLMFSLAGVEFEDVRLTDDQWKERKPKTRFGQLPILEVDGKEYVESRAIVTYLAKEFGYYGSSNLEALEIEQVLSMVGDLISDAIRFYVHAPSDQKEELLKVFKEESAPKYLGKVEKVIKENGTGFCVGTSITVADVVSADFIFRISQFCPGILEAYPSISGLIEKVDNLDNIKAYKAKRPVS